MSDPDPRSDASRLDALEERLRAAASVPAKPRADEHYSQVSLAWRMVIELVAGLAIGFGIGYGIDWLLGTLPIFLVIFIFLGLAAGIKTMLRSAQEAQRRQDASREPGASNGTGG